MSSLWVSANEMIPPRLSCDLCGLSLREETISWITNDIEYRFCCMGCRQVFVMLAEAAENADPSEFRHSDLYRQCQEAGVIPRSDADLERIQGETPDGSTTVELVGAAAGLRLHLSIDGMWCPACGWVVEETLKKKPGILAASCNFSTDRVTVDYNPVGTSPSRIQSDIERLGYRAAPFGESTRGRQDRREFMRFAISTFLTMNIMMLSIALYSGFFSELSEDSIRKLSWPIFGLATAVLIYGGSGIFRKAVMGIPYGTYGMETLVSAGAISAYVYSTVNYFAGSIHLYFDTSAMLITLVLLGKTLERKAKDQVQRDLAGFFSLKPTKVRRIDAIYPHGRYVSAVYLQTGDRFRIEQDEIIPADGLVLEGTGTVDESSLTGEALPVQKQPGDRLRSGTRVARGRFTVRAEAVGDTSTLGQMIRIMEQALGEKTPLEGKTDRILKFLVPAILVLSVGTGLVCKLLGMGSDVALTRMITVMVISCPCALGIAIPLARVAGISLAAKHGILLHDFAAFSSAEQLDAVVFDKTGTLTRGQWQLLELRPAGVISVNWLAALAAGLERRADHYIAVEIRKYAAQAGVSALDMDDIHVADNGVSGIREGSTVRIGSKDFIGSGSPLSRRIWEKLQAGIDSSRSIVYMTIDDQPAAILIFGDQLRNGAAQAIIALKQRRLRTGLISGDGEATTMAVATTLGIEEARGAQLPDDKVAVISDLQSSGWRAAMVGDGINDAPALAQSDLGIAVHSGGHLGSDAADITLMRSDPEQVVEFLELAERVNRKIRQNLVCAFLYNGISIPVAMGGLLSPLVAVTAMLLSSLSVIGNTLLLIKRSAD